MDKWSEVQAKRMELGGNQAALEFFKSHPDYRENMTIPEKYQSEFAIFYKEKLSAMCDGTPWTMPPIGSKRPAVVSQSEPKQNPLVPNIPSKAENERFFASKAEENAMRPEHLPPSQGGRYTGFGSSSNISAPQEDPFEDPLATISKGWSMFSSFAAQGAKLAINGAETLGKTVTENVIKPTAAAVRDPEFDKNISTYMTQIGSKVTEVGAITMAKASEVASKGLDIAATQIAVATEVAHKGIDIASNQLASLNRYEEMPTDREEWAVDVPESNQPTLWEDWKQTRKESAPKQPESLPTQPESQPEAPVVKPSEAKPSAVDEWEDF